MTNLTTVEAEIGNLLPSCEALKKQLWLVMTNLRERNQEMATINYGEFKVNLKQMALQVEKIQRKIEEFEAAQP